MSVFSWSACKWRDLGYFFLFGTHELCLSEEQLHFLVPPHLPSNILRATLDLLSPAALPPPPANPSPVKWTSVAIAAFTSEKSALTLELPASSGLPKQVTWHRRGDYLATVCKSNSYFCRHHVSLFCSRKRGSRRRLDSSTIPPPLTGTIQED